MFLTPHPSGLLKWSLESPATQKHVRSWDDEFNPKLNSSVMGDNKGVHTYIVISSRLLSGSVSTSLILVSIKTGAFIIEAAHEYGNNDPDDNHKKVPREWLFPGHNTTTTMVRLPIPYGIRPPQRTLPRKSLSTQMRIKHVSLHLEHGYKLRVCDHPSLPPGQHNYPWPSCNRMIVAERSFRDLNNGSFVPQAFCYYRLIRRGRKYKFKLGRVGECI